MNISGPSLGNHFLFSVHMIAVTALIVGIILLIAWAIKHLSSAKLLQWGWALLIVGGIVCLLTMSAIGGMRPGFHINNTPRYEGMMGQNIPPSLRGAVQNDEEAQGEALYDALTTQEKTCADLKDSEFELIGEYVMGARTGDRHDAMNTMMKKMMGEKGEEQMHIALGRDVTGCGVSQ